MSTNPYISYYINQAGSGISGYDGTRFQRGNGFFGSIFKNAILPVLKYLGKKAAATGAQVATDTLSGDNIFNSIKSRGKRTFQDIAEDAGNRAIQFAQTGKGKKRRRKANSKRKLSKKKKTTKRRAKKSIFQ